jgi:recombination associated protein RdgC
MWFKNLIVYRLPADWSVAPAELEEKLAQRALQPCGSFDMQSRGWVHASCGRRFVHNHDDKHLIAARRRAEALPSSSVRQVAQDRAKSSKSSRVPGRRPANARDHRSASSRAARSRAFAPPHHDRAWIDPAQAGSS